MSLPSKVSIADHERSTKVYIPKITGNRGVICAAIDHVLDLIIRDQDTGKSNIGRVLEAEYGASFAHQIGVAVDIRRGRIAHYEKVGEQIAKDVRGAETAAPVPPKPKY